jgi:hypothetical protein
VVFFIFLPRLRGRCRAPSARWTGGATDSPCFLSTLSLIAQTMPLHQRAIVARCHLPPLRCAARGRKGKEQICICDGPVLVGEVSFGARPPRIFDCFDFQSKKSKRDARRRRVMSKHVKDRTGLETRAGFRRPQALWRRMTAFSRGKGGRPGVAGWNPRSCRAPIKPNGRCSDGLNERSTRGVFDFLISLISYDCFSKGGARSCLAE